MFTKDSIAVVEKPGDVFIHIDSVCFLFGLRWYTREMNISVTRVGLILVAESYVSFKHAWPSCPSVGSHIVLIGTVLPAPWPTNPQLASMGVSNPPFGTRLPFTGTELSITVG